jgi:hypothetical protein
MEGGHLRLVKKEIQHLDFKWMVKIAHTMSFTNKHKIKGQAIFTVLGHVVEVQRLPESCQLHLQNWRSIFLSGYSSHVKYSFSATNWRYMQKSCECTWPLWQNLSSTYGHTSKISKDISGHKGSSQLKARFTLGVQAQTLGANFEHFGLFVGPNLLINARTLTSGY